MKAACPNTMMALEPTSQKKSAMGEANHSSGIPGEMRRGR